MFYPTFGVKPFLAELGRADQCKCKQWSTGNPSVTVANREDLGASYVTGTQLV